MSGPTAGNVEGTVAPGFERVADELARSFAVRGEVGAACCVYVDGEPVVDIWGGVADIATGRPWASDTPVVVFSTTKGATAVCIHRLVERGVLDPDAPIATWWPEFAAAGKEQLRLRDVLAHRAGLAIVDGDFTLDAVLATRAVPEALAGQTPAWPPGEGPPGYHMRSYGWILGEVVRRVTGRTLGRYFADEVAGLLALDWWIGLPEAIEARVAAIIPPPAADDPEVQRLIDEATGPDTLLGRAMRGPSDLFAYDERWNTRAFHAAEMPSSNGIATAHAVARMYAATVGEVDGVRLLAPQTVERARTVESDGNDRVIGFPMRWGLGFALGPSLSPRCGPEAFGHPGAGGSLGFADPTHRLGFGYVMSQMQLGVTGDRRANALVRAVYEALAV